MVKKVTCTQRTRHSSGLPQVSDGEQPLFPSDPYQRLTSSENMVEATRSLDIPLPKDQASGDAIGGYFTPHNMDPTEYRRSSAKEAYYDTASSRENFHLIAGHQATRVLTSGANGTVRATGVEVSIISSIFRDLWSTYNV